MHIAMFSWESMHSIAVGGIAPHVTELSSALTRLGHEVHVFTRQGEKQSGYEFIEGVHYHRCPFAPHPDFHVYVERMNDSFVWHFAETEARMGRRFDVVHGHDWLATRALTLAKNQHGRPAVITIHSTEYGRCGNSFWPDDMSKRIRHLEWEGSFVADRVICVSKTLAAETQRIYSVPGDKLIPVYNGVDVAKYDAAVDTRDVRSRHAIGSDDTMVLFAGRMTWQKGPDILLEAVPRVLEKNPRARLIFAGEGDMRTGLESRARDLGVADRASFIGHRTGRDLVGLFKSADIVCVPSRNEPFGIVILEAWSASKPVLATRIGGPAEFVEEDYTGRTVDIGVDTIGHGLNRMLDDMDHARCMGANGRREAEARFTWDHAALATEAVYKRVTGDSSTNGALLLAAHGEMDEMTTKRTGPTRANNGRGSAAPTKSRDIGDVVVSPRNESAVSNTAVPMEERIRRRAHEIFLARKGAPGDPVADWLQAEKEVRDAMANETASNSDSGRARQPARAKA